MQRGLQMFEIWRTVSTVIKFNRVCSVVDTRTCGCPLKLGVEAGRIPDASGDKLGMGSVRGLQQHEPGGALPRRL